MLEEAPPLLFGEAADFRRAVSDAIGVDQELAGRECARRGRRLRFVQEKLDDQEPPARRDRLVRSFQRDTIFLHVETVHDVR